MAADEYVRLQRIVGDPFEVPFRDIESLDISFGIFSREVRFSCTAGVEHRIRGLPPRSAKQLFGLIEEGVQKAFGKSHEAYERNRDGLLHAGAEARALVDRSRFLSHGAVESWRSRHDFLQDVVRLRSDDLGLDENVQRAVKLLQRLFDTGSEYVCRRNEVWVSQELVDRRAWFDRCEQFPLTQRQREAILRDQDRCLVVAGAGTGKTSTVVAKVGYLLEKGHAEAEEILVLAFARKASEELQQRIRSRYDVEPNVRTFHSLGMAILSEADGRRPTLAKVAESEVQLRRLLEGFLDRLFEVKELHELAFRFFPYYLKPYQNEFEFETKDALYRSLIARDIRTLKGEIVQSHAEMLIANWLFVHGVEYRYEAPYHAKDTSDSTHRQYQPDFFLPAYKIYIEHWGIDRDGNTAPFVNRYAYHRDMKWKRELHQEHRTTLVETFHYEQREGTLLSGLESKLVALSVQPERISADQLKQKLVGLNEFRPFTGLLGTFLSLFKSHPVTFEGVKARAETASDPARSLAFLELFQGIFHQYEEHLQQERTIDFHDMISQATERVRSGKYRSPSTQIIVDEFQDISPARAELLKALLAQRDDSHLFCVGDDWQSIFRFAGADLEIMTRFTRHFGVTQRTDLDRTFRFNDLILSGTSRFVTANPDQLRKEMSSESQAAQPPIHVLISPAGTLLELQLMKALDRVAERNSTASVLLLARFNHTLKEVPKKLLQQYPRLRVRSHTVHAAKGLEADYVVVMDVVAGKYGFPCEIIDDPVLALLLADTDRFRNAEERRLFYVAMTRARHAVYVLSNDARTSNFVSELAGVEYASEAKVFGTDWQPARCPICSGQLVRREGPHGIFWGCSNYPYCTGKGYTCRECEKGVIMISDDEATCSNSECNYKPKVCKGCRKGIMVPRNGPTGEFYGCSTYPDCRKTVNAL